MNIVLTISVFFLLSLTGAYILFKFLKSSALVKTRRYRAGGAVGGFLIIYGMLFGSYYQIAKQGPTITGTVSPKLPMGRVVLVVSTDQLGARETFSLRTPFNLNLKKDKATVYLIAPPGERFADSGDSVTWFPIETDYDLKHVVFDAHLEAAAPVLQEHPEGGQPR